MGKDYSRANKLIGLLIEDSIKLENPWVLFVGLFQPPPRRARLDPVSELSAHHSQAFPTMSSHIH